MEEAFDFLSYLNFLPGDITTANDMFAHLKIFKNS